MNPRKRVESMKARCKNDARHWIHNVREDKEPTAEYLSSWANNVDRRFKSFDELEANGTKEQTFAYDDAQNRYSAKDKAKIQGHLARGRGSGGGYERRADDDHKRQRRGDR